MKARHKFLEGMNLKALHGMSKVFVFSSPRLGQFLLLLLKQKTLLFLSLSLSLFLLFNQIYILLHVQLCFIFFPSSHEQFIER